MLGIELKQRFEDMANILEMMEESFFKIRAYRTGAERVEGLSEEILENSSVSELKKIQGIGAAIAQKIVEYRETGKIEALETLKKGLPEGLLDLLQIPGLGPKTLKVLWGELQVRNMQDLQRVLQEGKLATLPNFGKKKVENLQKGVEFFEQNEQRIPYAEARKKADEILESMKTCPGILSIEVAGSLRRKKAMIRDIDILVASHHPQQVVNFFLALPIVHEVNAHGDTKASIFTTDYRQVDLRVVEPESFGTALQYFTGSKEHNILLRRIAQKQGLRLSEYGVFRGSEKLEGETEQGVYEVLGQQWVEPEKRLGEGEFSST